jgi:hypothetical protein
VVQQKIDDGGVGPGGKGGRVAANCYADDGEDARADDGADSQRSQGDRPKRLLQRMLRPLRFRDQLVDRFSSEYLSGQLVRSLKQN